MMSNIDESNQSHIDSKWRPEATKDFKFAVDKKSLSPSKNETGVQVGLFSGYASVYNNTDLQGDICERGCFARTLAHKDSVVPLLWQHEQGMPIGVVRIEDSDQGLVAHGEINLEVEKGREAYALLKQGALKGLSIGYDVIKDGWKGKTRLLRELKLYEISIVTFSANPLARVTSVKSVSPYQEDILIADASQPWDAAEAKKRVKEYTTKDDKFDQKTFAKAFLWYDENAVDADMNGYPDVQGAYRLPICDVVDGKLQIVPRALYAAAAAIQGGRGDLPEKETNAIKSTISKYYSKLNKSTPWEAETKTAFEVGLYSVIAMSEPANKKSLTDDERRLVQIAIDSLKQLIETSDMGGLTDTCNICEACAEAVPAAADGEMPFVTYELNGEEDVQKLMAILDKILGGKALDDKEREFMGKIQTDLKDAAVKVETKAAEVKPAAPFHDDLKIADYDAQWSETAAKARLENWAVGSDGKVDANKLSKAFVGEFPICDIIDGELQVVPRALYAAAAAIKHDRSEKSEGIKSTLSQYYSKIGMPAPFGTKGAQPSEIKGTVAKFDEKLSIAESDAAWDGNAARQNIAKWATIDGKMDMAKYSQAFLWYNEKAASKDEDGYPEILGAYKLPFCDVVDGKLTVVPKALYAAAAVMMGSRGGVSVPTADVAAIKETLGQYYGKMKKTAPWDAEEKSLQHVWKEHFIPALKAYGKDVETNGEMSEETKKMFLEIGQKLQVIEEDMTQTDGIWNDFVETLAAYGEDVFTKGEPRKEVAEKLAFLQERIFIKEVKAAPAPAEEAAAANEDVECPKCGAMLSVAIPGEYTCPDCKIDFDVDANGKAVITAAAPEKQPAPSPAPVAAPAAAPAKSEEVAEETKAKAIEVDCACPKCKAKFAAEIDGSADEYTIVCPECEAEFDVDAEGKPVKATPAEEEPQAPEETKKEAAEPKIEAAPEVKAADAPETKTATTVDMAKATEVPVATPEVAPENITVTPAESPLETKGLDSNEISDSESEDNSLVEILEDFRTIREVVKNLKK